MLEHARRAGWDVTLSSMPRSRVERSAGFHLGDALGGRREGLDAGVFDQPDGAAQRAGELALHHRAAHAGHLATCGRRRRCGEGDAHALGGEAQEARVRERLAVPGRGLAHRVDRALPLVFVGHRRAVGGADGRRAARARLAREALPVRRFSPRGRGLSESQAGTRPTRTASGLFSGGNDLDGAGQGPVDAAALQGRRRPPALPRAEGAPWRAQEREEAERRDEPRGLRCERSWELERPPGAPAARASARPWRASRRGRSGRGSTPRGRGAAALSSAISSASLRLGGAGDLPDRACTTSKRRASCAASASLGKRQHGLALGVGELLGRLAGGLGDEHVAQLQRELLGEAACRSTPRVAQLLDAREQRFASRRTSASANVVDDGAVDGAERLGDGLVGRGRCRRRRAPGRAARARRACRPRTGGR